MEGEQEEQQEEEEEEEEAEPIVRAQSSRALCSAMSSVTLGWVDVHRPTMAR